MVLNHIFSKTSSPEKDKKNRKEKEKEKEKGQEKKDKKHKNRNTNKERSPSRGGIAIPAPEVPDSPASSQGSPQKSSSSPRKSPSKSPTKSSLAHRDLYPHHSRSSSAASRHSFFSSSRHSHSRDSHPLNLPPDELRRHLSAMAAAREDMRSSMDIDRETTSSPQAPDTPTVQEPTTNGVHNGEQERSPTPPPHRSSPPQSQPSDGGESFKLAGNKFYKAGDYGRAIQEYNKGRSPVVFSYGKKERKFFFLPL
jgi:DnaJ family protein C protein 7